MSSMDRTTSPATASRQVTNRDRRQLSWSQSQAISRAASHLILATVGILFFMPFFWLISTSLKELDQIFRMPPIWIPDPVRWQNYPDALGYFPFLQQLGNTLTIAISAVVLTLVSSALVAYSFSRLRWPGRNLLFFLML